MRGSCWIGVQLTELGVGNVSFFLKGFKHSLREVLQDPNLQARLADTKASEEVRMLEAFFKMMQVTNLISSGTEACFCIANIEPVGYWTSLFRNKLFKTTKCS